MTVAKNNFDKHIEQCNDAINIYEYLRKTGYSADFGLRYVWVASISALDHFVSELVIEIATERYANSGPMTSKMLNERIPVAAMLEVKSASPAKSILEFRSAFRDIVRFQTFQKANDIAGGLAYIWEEKHKWKKIAANMNLTDRQVKERLNGIAYRRDGIVHSSDFNETTNELYNCSLEDAKKAIFHIISVVDSIEHLANK